VSEPASPTPPEGPGGEPQAEGLAEQYTVLQKAGGLLAPVLTVLLAFLIGGIVVLATTGSLEKTARTYWAIFEGSGLSWFFEVGSHSIGVPFSDASVWFPWNTDDFASESASNLQQTLILWIPLVLTGLAVAFAFRCGLFNIGGNGQYLSGVIVAVIIGAELTEVADLPGWLLLPLCLVAGTLAGAALAGIAGLLKATVGAHEVISTIMLNWIVVWVGSYMFGIGGPFQTDLDKALPVSNDIVEAAKLTVFWGDPELQGVHIGLLLAIAALVVYSVVLNRTTLGYEVRAVGFNPEGARYGGINVAKNYFLAMAIAGGFAGLAGAIDVLGWKFRVDITDLQGGTIGFVGIAVALLGRNTAVGVALAALLFAALQTGTSTRALDPEIFQPDLATSLTVIIQGLVVLFVGADLLILMMLRWIRRPAGEGAAT
jgi:simple sugar transport system permease protein